MGVADGQVVIYAASGMPEDDSSITGGDINSGIRLKFTDLMAPATIVAYSSSRADLNTLTVYGKNTGGSIVNEEIEVSGTGLSIAGSTSFSGILKATLSHVTGVGTITVSGSSENIITTIPINESGFRSPFYGAQAAVGAKTLYEKVFVKNNSGSSSITPAAMVAFSGGGVASSKIVYGLENGKSVDPSGAGVEESVANRTIAPSNVGVYSSGTSGVWPSGTGNLEPTAYQGIWLKLSLDAGGGPFSAPYSIECSGMT